MNSGVTPDGIRLLSNTRNKGCMIYARNTKCTDVTSSGINRTSCIFLSVYLMPFALSLKPFTRWRSVEISKDKIAEKEDYLFSFGFHVVVVADVKIVQT